MTRTSLRVFANARQKLSILIIVPILLLAAAVFTTKYGVTRNPLAIQYLSKGETLILGIDESRSRVRGYRFQYLFSTGHENSEKANIWTILVVNGGSLRSYQSAFDGGCNLVPLDDSAYLTCTSTESGKHRTKQSLYKLTDNGAVLATHELPNGTFEDISQSQGWTWRIIYLPSKDSEERIPIDTSAVLSVTTKPPRSEVHLEHSGKSIWSKEFLTTSGFVSKSVFSQWFHVEEPRFTESL